MISIIIPTKNEATVLKKTLDAVALYQGDYEIILSDGKSTDGTLDIARKYTDKIVEYAGSVRQTIGQGRNAGAAVARGDILVFIDADVVIPDANDFFTKMLAVFEPHEDEKSGDAKKTDKIIAMTTEYRVLPEMATLADRIIFKLVGFSFWISNNVLKTGGSGGEFIAVHRDAFKKIGGFDETLAVAEDNELFWRLAKVGRTHYEKNLCIYHTGRRAHKIGWPKLLWQWQINLISIKLFKRSAHAEWKEIR